MPVFGSAQNIGVTNRLDDVAATVYPYDDYTLARSLVDSEPPEDDLFVGVRELVYDPGSR